MLTISTGSKAHTYISQFIDTHDLGERFSYGPPPGGIGRSVRGRFTRVCIRLLSGSTFLGTPMESHSSEALQHYLAALWPGAIIKVTARQRILLVAPPQHTPSYQLTS